MLGPAYTAGQPGILYGRTPSALYVSPTYTKPAEMKVRAIAVFLSALLLLSPGSPRAEELESLQQWVGQLETTLKALSVRLDGLGPVVATREVRIADPVFIGAGAKSLNSLSMDNPIINCPRHSFVSAVQVLKTGNTVSQIRNACRGIE